MSAHQNRKSVNVSNFSNMLQSRDFGRMMFNDSRNDGNSSINFSKLNQLNIDKLNSITSLEDQQRLNEPSKPTTKHRPKSIITRGRSEYHRIFDKQSKNQGNDNRLIHLTPSKNQGSVSKFTDRLKYA